MSKWVESSFQLNVLPQSSVYCMITKCCGRWAFAKQIPYQICGIRDCVADDVKEIYEQVEQQI